MRNNLNSITRFNPLGNELSRFDLPWDINRALDSFMMRPFPFYREEIQVGPQIRMDVKEADGKYLVKAEIPGVKKEDIHVTIDGNLVSISAEVKQEKETKEGERMIRCERNYGMATRSFTLADEVDQGHVLAKYQDGVLELTLSKKPGSSRKEISIS